MSLGPCSFFIYLRALYFLLFHQHSLMVKISSSSKSSQSTSFKTGPPSKKALITKAKQEHVKKCIGQYFLCKVVTYLILRQTDENKNPTLKHPHPSKCSLFGELPLFTSLYTDHKVHAEYDAKLKSPQYTYPNPSIQFYNNFINPAS